MRRIRASQALVNLYPRTIQGLDVEWRAAKPGWPSQLHVPLLRVLLFTREQNGCWRKGHSKWTCGLNDPTYPAVQLLLADTPLPFRQRWLIDLDDTRTIQEVVPAKYYNLLNYVWSGT